MHYYRRNIGDYAKKAGRLSMLEHGAYNLLLDACYDRERFPTKSEAIEWTWARTPEEIAAVEFVLSRFFTESDDGRFVQARIADELLEYQAKTDEIEARRDASKKAAADRVSRYRADRSAMFDLLKAQGIAPPFNITQADLRALCAPFLGDVTAAEALQNEPGGVTASDVTAPPREVTAINQEPLTNNQKPVKEHGAACASLPLPLGDAGGVAPTRKTRSTVSKATRLPGDWIPPGDWIAWATAEGMALDRVWREVEVFRDYWTAKSGQDATKADWQATWRNWIRRAMQPGGPFGNSAPAATQGFQEAHGDRSWADGDFMRTHTDPAWRHGLTIDGEAT